MPKRDAGQFQLVSDFRPTGDQPQAIEAMTRGLREGMGHQVLLGATGTGKTFSIAHVIANVNRPTLVMAHNKTLAAQLYSEFKEFFPHNAVEYFVSYYDYYQPEAYVPQYDLHIEKDADINEDIERLRMAATVALMTRRDVIIVASVSCIYGLGSPDEWNQSMVELHTGDRLRRNNILRRLVDIHYTRNDTVLKRGTFRVRGDTLEIAPASGETAYRVAMFGDEIERLTEFDAMTGEVLVDHEELSIFPAKHFVTDKEKVQEALTDIEKELEEQVKFFEEQGKLVEAQRLEQRTRFDMEMIREIGYVSGIENYSRHLDRRPPGSPPWTLIDFFPADFLLVLDESHMTVPQIRGMYAGDQSRKRTLVEYGFRLPSAMDNRPLNFDEFLERTGQTLYTSATPADYEQDIADQIVQQVIRPTGVLDPVVDVRPTEGQIDDLIHEVSQRVKHGQRALITTLTKRMSEDLTEYLREMEINVNYLHSEVDTLERVEILRDLRMGVYDVIVGVNLLREGLDLPEVSLIGILDADKEGFLRSETALVQTIGRAARHVEGTVIMYADKMTDSMRGAIDETARRREIQQAYNEAHGIEPASIVKEVKDLTQRVRQMAESDREMRGEPSPADLPRADLDKLIRELERQMKDAAQRLEFEKAAVLRDQIIELRQVMAVKVATDEDEAPLWQRDLIGASEVEED